MWPMSNRIGTYARAIASTTAPAMTMSVMTADDIDNNEASSEPLQIDSTSLPEADMDRAADVERLPQDLEFLESAQSKRSAI